MALTMKSGKPGTGMQILGQSGAGMVPMYLGRLITRDQPSMSATAKRFLRINSFIERDLEVPEKSGAFDARLFEMDATRRLLAADLIGYGCEPVLAEGLTPNFCQAGVVAPPDSPGFGKNGSIC